MPDVPGNGVTFGWLGKAVAGTILVGFPAMLAGGVAAWVRAEQWRARMEERQEQNIRDIQALRVRLNDALEQSTDVRWRTWRAEQRLDGHDKEIEVLEQKVEAGWIPARRR